MTSSLVAFSSASAGCHSSCETTRQTGRASFVRPRISWCVMETSEIGRRGETHPMEKKKEPCVRMLYLFLLTSLSALSVRFAKCDFDNMTFHRVEVGKSSSSTTSRSFSTSSPPLGGEIDVGIGSRLNRRVISLSLSLEHLSLCVATTLCCSKLVVIAGSFICNAVAGLLSALVGDGRFGIGAVLREDWVVHLAPDP